MTRTLAGYTDRISACPGETIAFKVSAEDGSKSYRASLVRLHCVDSHRRRPWSAGRRRFRAPSTASIRRASSRSPSALTVSSKAAAPIAELASFSVVAMVWPTLEKATPQVAGFDLAADGDSASCLSLAPGGILALPSARRRHRPLAPASAARMDAGGGELRRGDGGDELHAQPAEYPCWLLAARTPIANAVARDSRPAAAGVSRSLRVSPSPGCPSNTTTVRSTARASSNRALPVESLQRLIC